jgi:DNA-binding response OmpR family regulator
MPARQQTICIIEDDAAIANLVSRVAAKTADRVLVWTSAAAALESMTGERPQLVIADVNLPQVQGPELIEQLRAKGVTCPVLFISGDGSLATLESSLRLDRASFLPKPFTADELSTAIWAALRQR